MARRKAVDVWAGAKSAKSYTQKHTPLLWENMLGTVYARRFQEEAVYFDYDWEAAHAHIGLDNYTDLRVCKVKYEYQGWPYKGKWALFGVPHPQHNAHVKAYWKNNLKQPYKG